MYLEVIRKTKLHKSLNLPAKNKLIAFNIQNELSSDDSADIGETHKEHTCNHLPPPTLTLLIF